MAYATINKPSLNFNTKLYTGNGGTQSITGVGFQPDLTWTKARSYTYWNWLTDAVRGVTKTIYSNASTEEQTQANGLTAFDTDGFTVGNNTDINNNTSTYASWNWKAGGGQGSSNTDGSINTTYTSANTTAGFSISSFTGTGSLATVGHGLGVAPKVIIIKNRSTTNGWEVYHESLGNTKYMQLHTTAAASTSATRWNNTSPTNSVFTVNTENGVNKSGSNLVAYCFAEKKGYSKFGLYDGNGNADGPFIYMGFKPAMVIYKRANDGTNNWSIFDNKRDPYNEIDAQLNPNLANAEGTSTRGDFLSNGWKVRTTSGSVNNSGSNYIYMAFAENPLVANVGNDGVPATAR
jgi:hypothetical protein|tara:strand:- start:9 stop:1055 length:1047 start_codon:yes stop_codon:yes gene_type:complete